MNLSSPLLFTPSEKLLTGARFFVLLQIVITWVAMAIEVRVFGFVRIVFKFILPIMIKVMDKKVLILDSLIQM